MSNAKGVLLLALASVVIALAFAPVSFAQDRPGYGKVVLLDQGWSTEDRLRYYFTSQGSAAMSYDIFLHLERANGEELFRADGNMASYGLVPYPADPKYNPDGLPIGITKTVVPDGPWKGEWVGLGCAACHNGQLEYQGTMISLSGGNNRAIDIHPLIAGLDDALTATVADPTKFTRLAERLGHSDGAGREALRKRLEENAAAVHGYRSVLSATPSSVGPGRMDALTLIHNQVQSRWLGVPENWLAPLAPAKPSFVWNVPQSAWAQWSGVLFDPLMRNVGEVLGVFARMDLTAKTPAEGLFDSTIDINGQIVSEDLLRRLAPPRWPEEVLGKIDQDKSGKGAQLFAQHCAGCHSTWPYRWSEPKKQGKRFIENAIVSVGVVGTDPGQFRSPQFEALPTAKPGPMSEHLPAPDTGATLTSPATLFRVIQLGTFEKAVTKLGLSDADLVSAHGYRPFYPEPPELIPALGAYKANPGEGMWASPPFLHNGSVPSLYELLLPAGERSRRFFLGREFDPVKVGVDTTGNSGNFLYDTALVGNSNAGHSFEDGPRRQGVIGPRLSEEERWALVEYMKSVPTQPGQTAPFGGPKDPVRAWEDKTFYNVRNPGSYNGAPKLSAAAVPALGQETVEASEKELIDSINRSTFDRLRSQFPPGARPVLRDAHPKAHGLVRAEFIVLDDLPKDLRYGVFKTPRAFDALIRFSAGNIEVQADTVPQAAGMAIKLLGVEGEKILAAEKDAKTQDFVMINFPGFFVRNLVDYEALHEAIDKGDQMAFFKNRPDEANAVKGMREQPLYNPLHVQYWSQTPYKLGSNAIKFSARPISRTDNNPPQTMGPDFLREVMIKEVGAEDVYFEFLVQLQTDAVEMPVENPLVIWNEARSPFQRVAIIRIPKQDIDAPGRQEIAENLAFNPWHSLPEQQPLGSINRARRVIYEAVSEFRRKANNVPREEPKSIPW